MSVVQFCKENELYFFVNDGRIFWLTAMDYASACEEQEEMEYMRSEQYVREYDRAFYSESVNY